LPLAEIGVAFLALALKPRGEDHHSSADKGHGQRGNEQRGKIDYGGHAPLPLPFSAAAVPVNLADQTNSEPIVGNYGARRQRCSLAPTVDHAPAPRLDCELGAWLSMSR
jgi:hypothetical protein